MQSPYFFSTLVLSLFEDLSSSVTFSIDSSCTLAFYFGEKNTYLWFLYMLKEEKLCIVLPVKNKYFKKVNSDVL